MPRKIAHPSLFILILGLGGLLSGGCGPTGDTEGLKQNVEKSKYNIVSLLIRPRDTQTISPLTAPPANPKYYFDHNDSEQLEALGITDSGAEITIKNVTWEMSDLTPNAGATTLSANGLLSTETMAANQTKEITISIHLADLIGSADIVISSHPLISNGLSIKIGSDLVNGTSQPMVVCDTKTLHAEGEFADGSIRDITGKINWPAAISDSNGKFLTRTATAAVFSAHTNATYTLTPDYKGQGSASFDMVVTQTGFSNLQTSPATLSLNISDTQTMTATADIDSGSGAINTDISQRAKWTSANTAIFTVDANGTVTAVATGGPANLTASCGTDSVNTSITVLEDNTIKSIEILDSDGSPISTKSLILNHTVNLKLRLTRTDDSTEDITTAADTEWSVIDIPDEVEPITVNSDNDKGLVTAVAEGDGTVVAKYKSFSADIAISVTAN